MTTTATRREQVVETLAALENVHGQLSPEVVLMAASDPASPLHKHFEWDDERAGAAYRIEQARELIRSVRVEITHHRRVLTTVQYVRDERMAPHDSMYLNISQVTAADLEEQTVDAEVKRLVALIERSRGIAVQLGREPEFLAAVRAALK